MPKKTDDDWLPDARGRYRRKVGLWKPAPDKVKEYTFSFGTDKDMAKARLARVRELWALVVKRESSPEVSDSIPTPDEFERVLSGNPPEPRWNGQDLFVAKQLAAGKVQIVMTRLQYDTPEGYAHRIAGMASTYPCVQFVPEDPDFYAPGAEYLRKAAEHQMRKIVRLSPNILPEVTESLHSAFDEYKKHIKQDAVEPTEAGPSLTFFGAQKIANLKSLKIRLKDRPLSTLDYDGCQDLLNFWRMRPLTKDKRIKPARPTGKRTCENRIAELMRFFRWLHRSKKFGWRKPQDFDELRTNVKDLPEERTSIAVLTERKFYLPDELAIINKHATPLERLLLLLGLNCGLKGAEQGTLLLDHLFLDRPHPNAQYLSKVSTFECHPEDKFILYSRNKSKVYGEFLLWPQTVEILQWAMRRQQRIVTQHGLKCRNLLVTDQGMLFYRLTEGKRNRSQIFTNKWSNLIKRVQKSEANFPAFPFSTLRDTAGDLVRQKAGGEVAATFLMHGQPIKQDDLLDLYTRRPFARVFKTLRELQEDLESVFKAAPKEVAEQPMQQYTPLNKREQIVKLKKQGKKVSEIVEEVGVSRATVFRTLDRLYFRPKRTPTEKKQKSD